MIRGIRFLLLVVSLLLVQGTAHAERVLYEVQVGDMLGGIALQFGVSVEQLLQWNQGLDPDRIRAGQSLVVYPDRGSAGGDVRVVVARGDTLGAIALANQVSVADLVSWNRGLDPDRIRVGQELRIRRTGRATRRVTYVVQPGDMLGRIAQRHGVTVDQIRSWNRGLDPDRIRNGQEILLILEGPETPSESIGRASAGRLINGEQLPPHPAYVIRNERVAWGANATIAALLDGFEHMRRSDPNLPRVRVHDLSDEDGGPLAGHRSHQSGRDADIGFYHAGCMRDCAYEAFDPSRLDADRQWRLFRYWIDNDLVEYIFIDYRYQEVLYEHARAEGATDAQLRAWFQYPAGRDVARGVIRHEPGHRDHLHVRFHCTGTDESCR